jgi:hypothetical protein
LIQHSPTKKSKGKHGETERESVPLGLMFADFLLCLRAVAMVHSTRLNAGGQTEQGSRISLLGQDQVMEEERVCAAALAKQLRAAAVGAQESARVAGMPETATRQGDPRAWDVDVIGWAKKQRENAAAAAGAAAADDASTRLQSDGLLPESVAASLYVLDLVLDRAVGTPLLLPSSPRGGVYGSINDAEDNIAQQDSARADDVAELHKALDKRVQKVPSARKASKPTTDKGAPGGRRVGVRVDGTGAAADTPERLAKKKQSARGKTYAEAKREADAEEYKKHQEAERKRKRRVQQTKKRLEKMRLEMESKEAAEQEEQDQLDDEKELVLQEKLLEEKENRLKERKAELEAQEVEEMELFKREVQEFKRAQKPSPERQPKASPLLSPQQSKQQAVQPLQLDKALELDISPLQSPKKQTGNNAAGREQGQRLLGLMTGGEEEPAEETAEENTAGREQGQRLLGLMMGGDEETPEEEMDGNVAGRVQGQRLLGLMVGAGGNDDAQPSSDVQPTPRQPQHLEHSPVQSPRRLKSPRRSKQHQEEAQAPAVAASTNQSAKPWEMGEGEWVGDWLTSFDPSDGTPYYHNKATEVTQWDKPREVALEEGSRRRAAIQANQAKEAAAQVQHAKDAAKAALQQAEELTQRLSPRPDVPSPRAAARSRIAARASPLQSPRVQASPRAPHAPPSPLRSPRRTPQRLARAKAHQVGDSAAHSHEDHTIEELAVPKVAAEKYDVRKRKGEEEKKKHERQAEERRQRRQEAVHARLEVARKQREEKERAESAKKEKEEDEDRARKAKQKRAEAKRRKEAKDRLNEFQRRKHEEVEAEAVKTALIDQAEKGTKEGVKKAEKAERKKEWLARQAELKAHENSRKRKKDRKKAREEEAEKQARLKVRGFLSDRGKEQEQNGQEDAEAVPAGLSHLRLKKGELDEFWQQGDEEDGDAEMGTMSLAEQRAARQEKGAAERQQQAAPNGSDGDGGDETASRASRYTNDEHQLELEQLDHQLDPADSSPIASSKSRPPASLDSVAEGGASSAAAVRARSDEAKREEDIRNEYLKRLAAAEAEEEEEGEGRAEEEAEEEAEGGDEGAQEQRVRALYDYEGAVDGGGNDELSFKRGEAIMVVSKVTAEEGWWMGEAGGQAGSPVRRGLFPVNYTGPLLQPK